ncbi:site-specific DNA-methyltransferase [Apilactobacillus micheneri]|uniref:site-specific DNA-methyltransferase (cytosine-N(4)-specific) n=1 Tax=Apilactobacillus micheneri TaxID=1899430 RepID=A0ABY2YZF0_9LACO|nr:site-specific DNA-methyltransferase [Apilactobacillus micheneri]TPR26257.1 site-specific DNA-methyltransferase [Apilactobacillus micheneri]TPR27011.1 site-specific DNA-methyltransferase [Apilactobacillus micheneri]TPR27869.1 site-specific DNA-methyltransferase [Apilactobacillus micheneri]TPR31774.1 site-specific DNA-methyltransferase [Apilactobacillus micheneri]TPR32178.1 site-specific DNA-methyltransferase [Apilactobacillus micheneri]
MENNNKKLLIRINKLLVQYNLTEMKQDQLDTIILDISRVLDRTVVQKFNLIKNDFNIKLDSNNRNNLRLYLLGYPNKEKDIFNSYKIKYNSQDLEIAYKYIFDCINNGKDNLIDTVISRYKINFLNIDNNVYNRYLKYINDMQRNKFQLVYLNINASEKLTSDDINNFVKINYNKITNYHNFVISFQDDSETIKWNTIAKVAIYMENFLIEDNFGVFKKRNKNRRINELIDFLDSNPNISDIKRVFDNIKDFYSGVSYGFQFVDLFISDDCKQKTLVMQKIELDETPKRCPSCFEENVRGNSYPKVLFKSFECQNPACPSRSKSGRGKRYDMLSAKRQILLKRNSYNDRINDELYSNFRRDIIKKGTIDLDSITQIYSWSGDNVLTNYKNERVYKGRNIRVVNINKYNGLKDETFKKLPIFKLLHNIKPLINLNETTNDSSFKFIDKNTIVINDNSNNILYYKNRFKINIKSAVTSPPYYNAREYSHWDNFICYLIDMMINAKATFNSMDNNSTYIYNVGDIVDQDNVYIKSHMSKSRLMLGFYSALVATIAGFSFNGDFIWDKGEVQSKRNSSANHFSGYLKPINSYEHNLVLYKGSNDVYFSDKIFKIPAVKKINSKGINNYGHTAPYPIELAKTILPYSSKSGYILDPFLGSGTTSIMANSNGYKSIGFEISDSYYELSVSRIMDSKLNLFN